MPLLQATIQRELTRIHTPATMNSGPVSPDAVHLMVKPSHSMLLSASALLAKLCAHAYGLSSLHICCMLCHGQSVFVMHRQFAATGAV